MHMFICYKHAYNRQINGLRKTHWIIFHVYITTSTLCGNLNLSYIVWYIFVIGGFARSHDKSSTEFSHLLYCIRPQCLFPSRFLEFLTSFSLQSTAIPLLTDFFSPTDSIQFLPTTSYLLDFIFWGGFLTHWRGIETVTNPHLKGFT